MSALQTGIYLYLCNNSTRQSRHISIIHRISIDKTCSSCFNNTLQITQVFNDKNSPISTILIFWCMFLSSSYPYKIYTIIDTPSSSSSFLYFCKKALSRSTHRLWRISCSLYNFCPLSVSLKKTFWLFPSTL